MSEFLLQCNGHYHQCSIYVRLKASFVKYAQEKPKDNVYRLQFALRLREGAEKGQLTPTLILHRYEEFLAMKTDNPDSEG